MQQLTITPTETAIAAGVFTYWALTAVNQDALKAQWASAGLDPAHLPVPTSKVRALGNAVSAYSSAGSGRATKIKSGWQLDRVIVDGDRGDSKARFELVCRIRLAIVNGRSGLTIEHADPANPSDLSRSIAREYQRQLKQWDAGALGSWLASRARNSCDAVALRPRGGVYFVPPAHREAWDQISGALEASGAVSVYRHPAVTDSQSAVAGILDAVLRESEQCATEIMASITTEALGKRGSRSRAARAERACKRLESYREILGSRLDGIASQLADVESAAVLASLAADAPTEAAA